MKINLFFKKHILNIKGACQTSCAELMKGNCSWPLINPKKQKKSKKYKHSGLLRLTNVNRSYHTHHYTLTSILYMTLM